MQYIQLVLPFLLALGVLTAETNWNQSLEKINRVADMVRRGHVEDEPATDMTRLEEGAIRGILRELEDPFTRYIPAQNYDSMQEDIEGGFGGIGITWTREEQWFRVISPMEGTPAWKAGIRAQDRIVSIEGQPTKKMSMEKGSALMKGSVGTSVRLGILREGEDEVLKYEIERDFIEVSSVRAAQLSTDFAYVRISAFTATTGEDLQNAVLELEGAMQIRGMVLDLRGNPGGLLNAAVEVAQMFLPPGQLVVSIRNRDEVSKSYRSSGDLHREWPMVVLIDGGSASASEIVAGALKDTRRALLAGTQSFGKGSVQTVLPLGDGSAVALTTAYYYTPGGIRIHGVGIRPDVKVSFPTLSEEELKEHRSELSAQAQKRYQTLEKKQEQELKGNPAAANLEQLKISKWDQPLRRAEELLKAIALFN